MTREEALGLGYGDALYHRTKRQGRKGDEPYRVKVTGSVRTWKKDPGRIEVPTKHGMRGHHTITEHTLDEWYTSEADAKKFGDVSREVQQTYKIEPDLDRERKVKELVELLVFHLSFPGATEEDQTVALAQWGLITLDAKKEMDEVMDRYHRRLPPFRGRGRYSK